MPLTATTSRAVRVEFRRDARVWCVRQEEFLSFSQGALLDGHLARINPVRRVIVLDTLHGTLLVNVEDALVHVDGALAELDLEGVRLQTREPSPVEAA